MMLVWYVAQWGACPSGRMSLGAMGATLTHPHSHSLIGQTLPRICAEKFAGRLTTVFSSKSLYIIGRFLFEFVNGHILSYVKLSLQYIQKSYNNLPGTILWVFYVIPEPEGKTLHSDVSVLSRPQVGFNSLKNCGD
jgi:hypothetical protein